MDDIIVKEDDEIKHYHNGRYLGKGCFAQCYEIYDRESEKLMVAKIINKDIIDKRKLIGRIKTEVEIHKSLIHPNVVMVCPGERPLYTVVVFN